MSELRDFLYLDTSKLYSFVSQIRGGLVSEISETIKRLGGLSAGITIGIPSLSGKVDASKNKENEQQQTIQLTDPAYFGVLYEYLKSESLITDIFSSDKLDRETIKIGQFVEIKGTAESPVVESWIGRIKALMDFFDRNSKLLLQTPSRSSRQRVSQGQISRKQIDLFKEMVSFLEDYVSISRREPGKQYIHLTDASQVVRVWCGLLPEYATLPLDEALPAEVKVLGRVEKILSENEIYKIVDFSQFGQTGEMVNMLEALSNLGPIIGHTQIKEEDLQAQYPDLFVTPIAIYR